MSHTMLTLSRRAIAIAALSSIAFAALAAGAGYWLAKQGGAGVAREGGSRDGRDVLYWYDPMVPDQHFDKAGKSPFMDMELVPRYAGQTPDASAVRISSGVSQNLGVRLARVERQSAQARVRVSGTLSFNERDVAVVQAKAGGFVESARPLAVGDIVRAGDALVILRVPQWTGALAEHLSLRRTGDEALTTASRQRLVMLGVPEADIRNGELSGAAPGTFAIRAPISGAVTALGVKSGMTVGEGMSLATINGLSPVWLTASVPQGIAGRLKPGAPAIASLPAFAGERIAGNIESILPQASTASRTVEVRIALPNLDGRLRPGMTAEVDLSDGEQRDILLAPAEAVIRTGRRTVVIVAGDQAGQFIPTDVELGAAYGDRIEIVRGLSDGQQVVASGQFLIDSEASLTGVLARLKGVDEMVSENAVSYTSDGRVTATDASGVTLAHTPVPALNWPAMTMKFGWGPEGLNATIKPGDNVDFRFKSGGAGYELEAITPRDDQR